jgi:hypothetical protein
MMLGLNIENTTSESFRVQLAGRYLAFDRFGSGSELRIDAGLGADPTIGASLYEPFRGTPLFGRHQGCRQPPDLQLRRRGPVHRSISRTRQAVDAELGINHSRESELTGGFEFGHVADTVRAGDPSLPELSGCETRFSCDGRWTSRTAR